MDCRFGLSKRQLRRCDFGDIQIQIQNRAVCACAALESVRGGERAEEASSEQQAAHLAEHAYAAHIVLINHVLIILNI